MVGAAQTPALPCAPSSAPLETNTDEVCAVPPAASGLRPGLSSHPARTHDVGRLGAGLQNLDGEGRGDVLHGDPVHHDDVVPGPKGQGGRSGCAPGAGLGRYLVFVRCPAGVLSRPPLPGALPRLRDQEASGTPGRGSQAPTAKPRVPGAVRPPRRPPPAPRRPAPHWSLPSAGPPGITSDTSTDPPARLRPPETAMPKPRRGS